MPKATPILTNFTAGELSPLLDGRVDISRYYNGCKTLENFLIMPYGGAKRRPGTYYAATAHTSSKRTRVIPFQFSTQQAYMLEFGDLYIRFYMNQGQIVAPDSVDDWANGVDYIVGDFVIEDSTTYICHEAHTAGTFLTDLGAGKWIEQEIYEIVTDYTQYDIFDLQFTQDADVMWITHPSHKPKKLSRTGHTAWTLTDYEPTADPFELIKDWVTSTAYIVGDWVLESSKVYHCISAHTSGTFATDLGNDLWVEDVISGVTKASPAVVTVTAHGYSDGDEIYIEAIVGMTELNSRRFVVANKTTDTFELNDSEGDDIDSSTYGEWSSAGTCKVIEHYPACVTLYEQRLFFASTRYDPQKVWGTKSDDFNDMTTGAEADDALEYTIGTEQVNAIRWLYPSKELVLGTTGGNFLLSSGSDQDPLTPTNVVVKLQTTFGVAKVMPKKIGNFVYYIQRNNKIVREFAYSVDIDEYLANDVTILAEHIAGGNIIDMDYQQSPYNILWCVRSDGQIAALTRQIPHEITGWSRIITDGLFESVAVIPGANGDDEVWFVVNRTIGGVTKRFIEYLKPMDFGDEQEDAFFVDAGVSKDEPTAITGATAADPVVITAVAHGLTTDDIVVIRGIVGMTELNKRKFVITRLTADTFSLQDKTTEVDIDGEEYTAWVSGGEVRECAESVSGLGHLVGKEVNLLVDGSVSPSKTVADSSVTLDDATGEGGEIHAGLNFISRMKSMRLEAGSALGTAQGKIKRIRKAVIRVYKSMGCQLGNDDKQDTIPFRSTSDPTDQPVPLFTGDKDVQFPSSYNKDAYIIALQEQPLPLNIICLIPFMEVYEG